MRLIGLGLRFVSNSFAGQGETDPDGKNGVLVQNGRCFANIYSNIDFFCHLVAMRARAFDPDVFAGFPHVIHKYINFGRRELHPHQQFGQALTCEYDYWLR